VPTPAGTFEALRSMLSDPFYDNGPDDKGIGILLLSSLQRVGIGFTFSALVGIPVGLAMGTSKRVWRAANPVIQLLRPVSPLAWYPILVYVLKDAPNAAVWVIFITELWPIIINTAAGAATVPSDQRNVARVFRFNRRVYVRHVLVPHTLPSVVTGLRLSMGIAWMVIVAAEMLSGGAGIGNYVWTSYNSLQLERITAAIVLIGTVGVVLDLLFMRLGHAVAIEEAQR
jgi:nitrate/nitrite transport system permease protein